MVTRKNIGGYRLVSLRFLDLALISTATACEGLAPALASKSKKRVVLTDIVVSGEPKNDVGVEVEAISGGYAIKNVYGYDLEIVTSGSTLKATPSTDHITASDIDSETATAGQALLADGDGGASFGNIEVGASQIDSETATAGQALLANGSGGVAFGDIGASNIKSGSATSGQVLTADGSGGVAFADPSGGGGGTQLYLHTIGGFSVYQGSTLYIISPDNAQLDSFTKLCNCRSVSIYAKGGGASNPKPLAYLLEGSGHFRAVGVDYDGTSYKFDQVADVTTAGVTVTDTVTAL